MTGSNWFEEYGIVDPYYADKYRAIVKGDCREILPSISGVSAVVTDPPYNLISISKRFGYEGARNTPAKETPQGSVWARKAGGFMGKRWDGTGVSLEPSTWDIIQQSCLPGATLLAFGGSRTSHRIACAIEDAGWELRDTIMWVYGSGFPKSLDISKAIDRKAGVKREVVGKRMDISYDGAERQPSQHQTIPEIGSRIGHNYGYKQKAWDTDVTKPASNLAQLWDGYGTSLKPAYEPIILAMNSLDGTFANNALKHGVAGLNIDSCRIPLNGDHPVAGKRTATFGTQETISGGDGSGGWDMNKKGRFPANLVHDGSEEVLGLFPQTGKSAGGKSGHTGAYGGGYKEEYYGDEKPGYGDNGSAARFFYCAKASRAERDAGLEGLPLGKPQRWNKAGEWTDDTTPARNNHPTVKPLALMVYLCRLVKMPSYNLILDPFCGSGTTLLACGNLGIRSIGIDSDEHFCEIAANRCAADAVARIQKGEY